LKVNDLPADVLEKVKHIVAEMGDVELPEPCGWFVLVLQYVRPAKVGNLFMPNQTRQEDIYQGRTGVVLAVGPDAYTGERFTSGAWVKPGDLVLWPPVEAAAARFSYGRDVTLALLNDDRVLAKNVDPFRATTSG
jgi:hypothetical protein